MTCLDENFERVVEHDILAPTVKLTNIHEGVHTYTCLLCNATEVIDIKQELILSDDIAFGGGSPSE